MGGFFDEEFTPDQVPETQYVHCEIPLALVKDHMMQANIARALNPDFRASFRYIAETILQMQDYSLEERNAALDRMRASDFFVNTHMVKNYIDMSQAAQDAGDGFLANLYAEFANVLLESLPPQQGKGIREAASPGFPEAGGVLSNAGGGRPALSPANTTPVPATPSAPAGPGTLAQAGRNVG